MASISFQAFFLTIHITFSKNICGWMLLFKTFSKMGNIICWLIPHNSYSEDRWEIVGIRFKGENPTYLGK